MARDEHDEERVPVLNASKFNLGDRPQRDAVFGYAYMALLCFTVLGAFVSFGTANKYAAVYQSSDFQNNIPSCSVKEFRAWQKSQASPTAPIVEDDGDIDAVIVPLLRAVGIVFAVWIPLSGVFGLGAGLFFLYLLSKWPEAMVRSMVTATLVIAAINMVAAFASGAFGVGLLVLIFCVFLGLVLCCSRAQLDLVARLFAIAGQALAANSTLLLTAVLVKLASFGCVVFLLFGWWAAMNTGDVSKAPGVKLGPTANQMDVDKSTAAVCVDDLGNPAACCQWQASTWSGVYSFFCWFVIGWTVLLMLELKLFLVAGTIGQWYFAPAGSTDFKGNTARSLRHALGSSFGSIAAAGLLIFAIRIIKHALHRLAQRNLLACIIATCLQGLLSLLEMFTKFVTVRMAITGEAFVDAARGMYDIVRRNFGETFGAWYLPALVLNTAVFLAALSWSTIAYIIMFVSFKGQGSDVATAAGWMAWLASFFISLYMLGFLASLFLDAVNSVFVCYAMDVETHVVTRPDVHEVVKLVPGSIIVNPDGNYAFASGLAPPAGGPSNPSTPMYGYAPPMVVPAPTFSSPAYPGYSTMPNTGTAAAVGHAAPPGYMPMKSVDERI